MPDDGTKVFPTMLLLPVCIFVLTGTPLGDHFPVEDGGLVLHRQILRKHYQVTGTRDFGSGGAATDRGGSGSTIRVTQTRGIEHRVVFRVLLLPEQPVIEIDQLKERNISECALSEARKAVRKYLKSRDLKQRLEFLKKGIPKRASPESPFQADPRLSEELARVLQECLDRHAAPGWRFQAAVFYDPVEKGWH